EDPVVAAGVPPGAEAIAQAAGLLALTLALLLLALLTRGAAVGPTRSPGGGDQLAEVVLAQDGDGDAEGGKDGTSDGGQPLAEPQELDRREEDGGQRCDEQADDQTESASDEIADLGMADHVEHPAVRGDDDIRCDDEGDASAERYDANKKPERWTPAMVTV